MTTLTGTALADVAHAQALTTVPATGALQLSWLLIAFPLFGAVVLLIGGRRTDRWGHLLGCAMPVAEQQDHRAEEQEGEQQPRQLQCPGSRHGGQRLGASDVREGRASQGRHPLST